MNTFKLFLESISPETLKWWSKYAGSKIFKTEQEAREWVFYQRERADKDPSQTALFGVDGPEKNRKFASEIPIYMSGKSFKIGKRVRNDNRLRISQFTVRKPDLYELNQVANSNGYNYEFHPVKWIPIRKLLPNQPDHYANEKQRIQSLANEIKENKWIEAIIYGFNYGQENNPYLIEGNHRTRAFHLLGFNTIPGVGIEYSDD